MQNSIFASGYRLYLQLAKLDYLLQEKVLNIAEITATCETGFKTINYLLLSIHRHQPIYNFTPKLELINLVDPIKDAIDNRERKLMDTDIKLQFTNNVANKLILYKAEYQRITELTCKLIDICRTLNQDDIAITCQETNSNFLVYIGQVGAQLHLVNYNELKFASTLPPKQNAELIIAEYLARLHHIKLVYNLQHTINFALIIPK